MFRHTSHAGSVARRFGLVLGLLLSVTTEGKAAGIVTATPEFPVAVLSCLGKLFSSDEGADMACFVDPLNTQAFNLNFRFDASKLELQSIVYISPFTQTTSPDLSQLSSGLIQGIAGSTSTLSSGDVDIFEIILHFRDNTFENTSFTVFAGSNSFVIGQDPNTGQQTTIGPNSITPMTTFVSIPEPSSLILLGMGLMVMAFFALRTHKRQLTREAPTAADSPFAGHSRQGSWMRWGSTGVQFVGALRSLPSDVSGTA